MAAKYQIEVPKWGWRCEKIEEGKDWLGNLANPTAVVDMVVPGEYALGVGLVEINGAVEIAEAEIQRWESDGSHPDGGFWGPPRRVPFEQIELVG
ncbi:MAG TPA: hypothetical protein VFN76_04255 [Candidatus Limnocylindria bacterium]|nr:hypothetical protein [Candidatus Limnocylindria bacterium]